ncbi:Uncharacterized protein APZ42_015327 [Daphnia magna]|uniref:Uncharacterized protein n=2 Tax=Daphnia magna TaxID=35525 RepID=A0ABQ9YPL7_9CRUS|nr:hypothetical protein OUZ56_004382 [Daphnia magna]KZS18741.1 Uncharacterized protein APZ42_015327 [Daphnia magna]
MRNCSCPAGSRFVAETLVGAARQYGVDMNAPQHLLRIRRGAKISTTTTMPLLLENNMKQQLD